MSISGVSSNDSSSFTHQYLQIADAWIKDFVYHQNSDQSSSNNSELSDNIEELEISEGDKIIYGKVNNRLVLNLNPEITQKLEQLKDTPVGKKFEFENPIIVKLNKKVILETDSEGQVKVNDYMNRNLENFQINNNLVQQNLSSSNTNEINQFNTVEIQNIKNSDNQAENEYKKGKNAISPLNLGDAKSSIGSIEASIKNLYESDLKKYLMNQITEIRGQYEQQLKSQQQQFDSLIQQRLKEHNNPKWWQEAKDNLSQRWNKFQERIHLYKSALALKKLFSSYNIPGSNAYHANEYTITRSGNLYQLKDANGNSILNFRDTAFGIKFEQNKSPLEEKHRKELLSLSDTIASGKVEGKFSPIGFKESEELSRIQKIAQTLSNYAKRQGKTVSVDGKFSYKWKASPDGRVLISAKDGRDSILAVGNGLFQSRMNERDLAYFEQVLPKLETASALKRSQNAASSQSERG